MQLQLQLQYAVTVYSYSMQLQYAELDFPVHAHQLRHACGYHLARQGKASYLIQSHLGHRNYKNTEIYIHWAGIPKGSINWSEQ